MQIGDLSAGSLLKLGLVCATMFWGVWGLIFGFSALMGADGIYFNGKPVYGPSGFMISVGCSAILAGVTGVSVMLGGLLARLIPPFRRAKLTLSEFKDLPEVPHPEN